MENKPEYHIPADIVDGAKTEQLMSIYNEYALIPDPDEFNVHDFMRVVLDKTGREISYDQGLKALDRAVADGKCTVRKVGKSRKYYRVVEGDGIDGDLT